MSAGPRRSGSLPPQATLTDVAREAGVSLATASRVLNGSTRGVRSSSREPVEAAAAQLGYQTNRIAQAMARGSTPTVALMVRDIRADYSGNIAAGLIEAAESVDLAVSISGGSGFDGDHLERLRTVRGHQPRAIILADYRFNDPRLREDLITALDSYQTSGVGIAVIGSDALPYPSVLFDDEAGARTLAQRLVGAGYRHPLFLGGSPLVPGASRRQMGFNVAFAEAGIRLRFAPPGDLTRDGAHAVVMALDHQDLTRTDVVVAVNDPTAIGAMSALRARHISVGPGIAVTGFDDTTDASDVRPRLTTVRLPRVAAGAEALRLALGDPPRTTVRLPVDVIWRDSTPAR